MNESMYALELIRQISDRVTKLETQQVWLLGTTVLTLVTVVVNMGLHLIKRNGNGKYKDTSK